MTAAKTPATFRPTLESLEDRNLLSWGSTPPSYVNLNASGNDRITISRFNNVGNYSATNSITRGEIDYRKFVAQRSGRYTFEAKISNSSGIDTVAALYDINGKRLGYNDDASSSTTNSKFTVTLTRGRTYTLGITNYTGTRNGAYQVLIKAPDIYSGWLTASSGGGDFKTEGYAELYGSTLEIYMYGHTTRDWYYTDHEIEVQILDLNGQPIHTGSWVRSFRTAGNFVPGSPINKFDTWYIDLSGWDLSRASQLYVEVRHD